VPLAMTAGAPVNDPRLAAKRDVPPYVSTYSRRR
jgi:hypothetical protein